MNSNPETLVLLIALVALVALVAFFVVLSWMKVSTIAGRVNARTPEIAIEELRQTLVQLQNRLAASQTAAPVPVEIDDIRQGLATIRERVEALAGDFERYANPPVVEPSRPDLAAVAARVGSIAPSSDGDRAFAEQCSRELELLKTLQDRIVATSDWTPESGDRSFLLNELFAPKRMDLLEVTSANRDEARILIHQIDDLRAQVAKELQSRFGIEPITPVAGTEFDPRWHEDNPSTRQTAPEPALANRVYERVSVGISKRGEVLERAWVKRYAGAMAEPEPATEPPSPSQVADPAPTSLQPPGPAEAAEVLLRKAAADD